MTKISILLASLVLSAATHAATVTASAAAPAPSNAAQWKAAAIRDIDAGYQITLDHHPGAHDAQNPAFLVNLAKARAHGLALADQVADASGYVAAVLGFNVRIRDGHAGMVPTVDPSLRPAERWPGFVAVWRGDMFVYASEAGGPPAGARIVSCDGKPIRQMVIDDVFGFQGRIDEAGQWWSNARVLFVDWGNPFVAAPKRCVFDADGRQVAQDLAWRPRSEQAARWRAASYNGDSYPVGMVEARKNLYWVAMPTFQPDEAQRAAYRAINRRIAEQRQRYLDADAIVVDLRHNQGGDSMWSKELAEVLWGADRVQRRSQASNARVEVWYRASQGNADYFSSLVTLYEKQNETASASWARNIDTKLKAALGRGDTFAVLSGAGAPAAGGSGSGDVPGDPPAFTKPLYVIVPGNCASACLDALDVFTLFPNTKLIGAPSSADSTYMEVRQQPLPSGLASVIVPTKVYVNRPRANGQVYLPAITVTDVNWSHQAFLKVVEQDLSAR